MNWREDIKKARKLMERRRERKLAPVGNMIEGTEPFPNKVPGF